MITKIQAEIISDQIIQESKPSISRPSTLPRHHGWLSFMASMSCIVAILLGKHAPGWFFGLFITLSVCLSLLAIWAYRKPVFEIDGSHLIYHGFWPGSIRIISIDAISKITFFTKMRFLRSARLILIETDTEEFRIWLRSGYELQVALVNHFFKANFRDQFIDIAN